MTTKKPRKLVVAIDFGTTFSGVAYWLGRDQPDSGNIKVICDWPAIFPYEGERPQVPTKVGYKNDGTIQWGNLASGELQPIQWVKLLLLEQQDLPHYLQHNQSAHLSTARELIQDLGKEAIDVVADYLRELWRHAMTKIKEYEIPAIVDDCVFHIILTVPAIWKGYARQKMQTAAERAGILKPTRRGDVSFSMTSEPEAAAHAILRSGDWRRKEADTGDTILVCDCGGGTVDVISYTLVNSETNELKECVEGDGALCGAVFVDEEFFKLVKGRFNVHFGRGFWDTVPLATIEKAFSTDWENGMKRNLSSSNMLMSFGIAGRNIDLNKKQITACFRKVLERIHILLDKQIEGVINATGAAPKYIFLVGGFGRCQLLFNAICEKYPDSFVIKGASNDEPWSAICRGAALGKAIEICASEENPDAPANPILSRKPRISQGWSHDLHLGEECTTEEFENAEWDNDAGGYVVHGTMAWLVKRGQDVSTHMHKQQYTIALPMDTRGHYSHTAPILESLNMSPPARYLPNGSDIRETGRVVTLTTPVPAEKLPIEQNGWGEDYLAFHYEWHIKVEGASVSGEAFSMGQKIAELAGSEI
ncbi:hypothetical protein PFICI_15076 [Pestalotiopsis fici W106-1]|uniref:Actin-like ATPase domain-containing protein n=1 Tax=Pestalotiopsis fici (strain W106-1 / CGMCC3.15140) TaxID=1229662 RepID=W3WJZ5_PESFW|nr:uncharacterized protein PFICI_15076 [Pestalotiopsis fici W106-1]ETS73131.1 hypothetical protein PFICI_15076 [Pestalotiopsis fici W106-1]